MTTVFTDAALPSVVELLSTSLNHPSVVAVSSITVGADAQLSAARVPPISV